MSTGAWGADWPDILANGLDPIKHPALTEPRTKEAWTRYVLMEDPATPPKLSLASYQRLLSTERARYNRARNRYHSQGVILNTRDLASFRSNLRTLLTINNPGKPGPKHAIALSGESTTGKSTAVKVVTREYERLLRTHHPDYFARYGDEFIPVAYLLVPFEITPKSLLLALVEYFGLPIAKSANANTMKTAIVKMFQRCGTAILVIDDLHFINAQGVEGREAINLIKELLGQTGITFVVTGVGLERGRLFPQTTPTPLQAQLSNWFEFQPFSFFSCGSDEEREHWVGTIAALEGSLCLLAHEPGTLPDLFEDLHARTGGGLEALSILLKKAALKATATGTERINEAVLDGIQIDATNQVRGSLETNTRSPYRPYRQR